MKNNTKLIMENWRKFLKEGDISEEGQYSDPDEQVSGEPVSDEDLESIPEYNNDDYDEEYNPGGFDQDFGHNPDGEMVPYVNDEDYDSEYNPGGLDQDFGHNPERLDDEPEYNDDDYDEEYNPLGFDQDFGHNPDGLG